MTYTFKQQFHVQFYGTITIVKTTLFWTSLQDMIFRQLKSGWSVSRISQSN